MNKWVTGLLLLGSAAVVSPILKMLYDPHTNSTGTLTTNNVTSEAITVFMAIPWLAPAIVFIFVLIIWARPGDPRDKYKRTR